MYIRSCYHPLSQFSYHMWLTTSECCWHGRCSVYIVYGANHNPKIWQFYPILWFRQPCEPLNLISHKLWKLNISGFDVVILIFDWPLRHLCWLWIFFVKISWLSHTLIFNLFQIFTGFSSFLWKQISGYFGHCSLPLCVVKYLDLFLHKCLSCPVSNTQSSIELDFIVLSIKFQVPSHPCSCTSCRR